MFPLHKNETKTNHEVENETNRLEFTQEVTVMKTEVKEEFYESHEPEEVKSIKTESDTSQIFVSHQNGVNLVLVNGTPENPEKKTNLVKTEFVKVFEKRHKCSKCNFSTNSNFIFRRHALVHSENKQLSCVICKKKFRRTSPLRDHLKIHDTKRERNFPCPFCPNSYYRKNNLMNHINSKHVDLKPYKCDICGYSSIEEQNLRRHILVKHRLTEKLFVCEFCHYSTDSKCHFADHSRTHTNLKPFKCTYKECKCPVQEENCNCATCDFTTSHSSTLKRHVLQIHSTETKKFKCTECNYSTHVKTDFVMHVRVHTEERPYECGYEDCDYKSKRREHLKLHIRYRHMQEKPFSCDKCNYTCVSRSNLKRHVTLKHA